MTDQPTDREEELRIVNDYLVPVPVPIEKMTDAELGKLIGLGQGLELYAKGGEAQANIRREREKYEAELARRCAGREDRKAPSWSEMPKAKLIETARYVADTYRGPDPWHWQDPMRALAERLEGVCAEREAEKAELEEARMHLDRLAGQYCLLEERAEAAEAELDRLRRIEKAANRVLWVKTEKLGKWERGEADPRNSCSTYTPDWIELGEALLALQPQEASEGQGDTDG